jgi:TetR/AcrR family transcriptional regulator
MGIPERKEREKEQRREMILDAAEKVFFGKGFPASTVDDIAAQAEVSKGTIYLYFKSKEDLLLGIHLRGQERMFGIFREAISGPEPVLVLVTKLGAAYYEFFKTHRNYFRIFQFFNNPQFHKEASQEMLDLCHEQGQKIWGLVTGLIGRAVKEGAFDPGLDPLQAAIILWSTGTHLMQLMDAGPEYWDKRMRIDLEETLRTSYRFLVEGMMRRELRAKAGELLAGTWIANR